ncbi:50S ribosomal protein L25/general stress protein Ctc [Corynebacterium breve]|uniref:Large ribosomal subunit protein bL25 n=1 Tax=Corynebacterium breve TaxID=3049799 RepID=A0ABY8VHP6_9CORY|nr:50S ribosomal protein L25/general stress protein Ctc [Corynebacterium breve]WIM68481.1 50S ribosomal protein L25/general stress protein Ctc [Corynebacterium breve]
MAETPVIKAEKREEFGKGASRRLRRDGRLPGVLYSAGEETLHFHADRLEVTALIRNDGVNAIAELEIDGEQHLSMVKFIDQNVITLNIDHIDMLGIKRGEKVEVDVPVIAEGEVFSGAMLIQEVDTILIEIDALKIPEEITVSVEGLQAGTQILAGDIQLPEGATLIDDAEALVLNITEEEEADLETDAGEEGAAGEESAADAPAEAPAED